MAAATESANSNLAHFERANRIVVKIGSALFVDQSTGRLDRPWLSALCEDLAELRRAGRQIVIVSSGAVALGRRELGLPAQRAGLEDNQAAAAAGQILLAHAYQECLGQFDIKVAQVLLTLDDSESRRRYLNASRTLLTLLSRDAIPVVNENDTVATEELRYGDNDALAGRVAQMVSADCLVVLSDVDGLYTADPQTDPGAEHLDEIREIGPDVLAMAGGPGSRHGSGGMLTKLEAARISIAAGCRMVITSGRVMRPISALRGGARSTWFLPAATPRAARKQWISGALKPRGSVRIDAGAVHALRSGRSLLPAGVTAVEGRFDRGDAVRVLDGEGRELGRGLVAYSSDEAAAIVGRRSEAIEEVLGYRRRDEMIHRDDLVLSSSG